MTEDHVPPPEDRGAAADPASRFAEAYAAALTRFPTVDRSFSYEVDPDDGETHDHFVSPEDPSDPAYLRGFVGQSHYAFFELGDVDADALQAVVPNLASGPIKMGVGFVDQRPDRTGGRDDDWPIRTAAAMLLVPVDYPTYFGGPGYLALSIEVEQDRQAETLKLETRMAAPDSAEPPQLSESPSLWEHQLEHALGVQVDSPSPVEPDKMLRVVELFNHAFGAITGDEQAAARANNHMASSTTIGPLTSSDGMVASELVETRLRGALDSPKLQANPGNIGI
jgi:hypothetical protein